MNVGEISMSCSAASARITRSIFSSPSVRQPVAALGLARRRAAAQHLVEAAARRGGERRFGRRARGDDGAEDAAAFGGDLGVGRAGQPPAQLLAPVAGEHDVRVRIDEAGHDGAAVRRR